MDAGIMANAEGYRRLAREALETANTVSSEEARAGLIEMAGAWTRLADKLAGDVPSMVGTAGDFTSMSSI